MSSIDIISGTQTRFLGIPPRLQIRIEDNRTGSYPVIRRTGDHDRMGFMSSTFNDANTIVFTGSSNVLYPQLLPRNSQMIQGLTGTIETFSSMSAGTSFVSSLISQSIIPGSAAPETITPFVDSRIYLSESAFYLTGTSPEQVLGFSSPLKDKTQIRIDITHNAPTAHYSTRFSRHSDGAGGDKFVTASSEFADRDITGFSYYNWDLKRWEDTGNIDPASQTPLQYDWAWHAEGQFATNNNDMISGSTSFPFQFTPNQASQANTSLDPLNIVLPAQNYRRAGYPTITGMAPFDTRYHATSSQCLKMSDYISSPFMLEKLVIELPVMAQRQVHGTGSNTSGVVPVHEKGLDGANQVPQQDYVFFVYRQQRKPFARGKYSGNNDHAPKTHSSGTAVTASLGGRDSHYGVSGSHRFLICSGVMTFYNTGVLNVRPLSMDPDSFSPPGVLSYNFLPFNGSAFSHKFTVDPLVGVDSINNQHSHFLVSGTFTGSVRMEIQPAVVAPSFHGHHYVPDSSAGYTMAGGSGDNKLVNGNAHLFNYWPGGTSCDAFRVGIDNPSYSREPVGGKDTDAFTVFGQHTYDFYPGKDIRGVNEHNDPQLPIQKISGSMGLLKIDPRVNRPFGGSHRLEQHPDIYSTFDKIGFDSMSTGSLQEKGPYLLFPEDELVFGLEACIGMTYFQDFYTVTGSRMNICTPQLHSNIREVNGGRASITMFGSLVREGKEYHETLNQNLTSNAIHEAIIGSPVVDQYDIASRDEMIGTYVDNYVVGNMHATGTTNGTKGIREDGGKLLREQLDFTRTVMGSFSSGTANPKGSSGTKTYYGSGSMQRFVRLSSRSERYYDTFLPDIYEYLVTYGGAGTPRIGNSISVGYDGMVGNMLLVTGSVVLQLNGNRMKLPFDNNIERYPESWGEIFNSATPLPDSTLSPEQPPSAAAELQGIFLAGENIINITTGLFINAIAAKRMLFETGKGSVLTDFNDQQAVTPMTDVDSGISGSARGFSYGIQNIDPQFSSAVFRWNRYGQFRDMLEQRQDGKFYIMEIAAEDEGSEQSPGLQSAVIKVDFVKESSTETVIPGDTQCSNLSFECTSSVPYYDGMFRNRSKEMDVEEEYVALI